MQQVTIQIEATDAADMLEQVRRQLLDQAARFALRAGRAAMRASDAAIAGDAVYCADQVSVANGHRATRDALLSAARALATVNK